MSSDSLILWAFELLFVVCKSGMWVCKSGMWTRRSSFCCAICFSLQDWISSCQTPGEWTRHYLSSILLWEYITCHKPNYYILWKVLRRLGIWFSWYCFINEKLYTPTVAEQIILEIPALLHWAKKAIIFWLCICRHIPCNQHMKMSRKSIVQKSMANASLGRKTL